MTTAALSIEFVVILMFNMQKLWLFDLPYPSLGSVDLKIYQRRVIIFVRVIGGLTKLVADNSYLSSII